RTSIAMSRIVSPPPIAPTRFAAPVVRLIEKSCDPVPAKLNEAKAAPLSDEMSKPTNPLGSTPSEPTVKTCPVLGETEEPLGDPWVASVLLSGLMTNRVVAVEPEKLLLYAAPARFGF